MKNFNVRSVSGIVTAVKKYYNGVIFITEKGRKIYVEKDILEDALKCSITNQSDFEKALFLIGSKVEAKGRIQSWYGGKYRCYIDADHFRVFDENVSEKVEEVVKRCLHFALRNEPEKKRSKIINNLLNTLLTFPENIFTRSMKGIKFPTVLALYRLVTKEKLLPFLALFPCLKWVLHELYDEERKVSLRYSEAMRYVREYFISLPEDPLVAKKYISGKLVIINRNSEKAVNEEDLDSDTNSSDFKYTTWEIFKMLEKAVSWTLEKTGEKNADKVKKIVFEVLQKGKYQPKHFRTIDVKAIPVFFVKNFIRDRNTVIISGSAGAGKTTFLKNLSEVLKEEGENVYSYALTRSAAGVVNGETIRQLQDAGIPSIAKYVFIDEAFMLDLKNFCSVISEAKEAKILFSGDPEQSPPPQGFEVFKNVVYPILLERSNVIRITSSHRFLQGRLNIVLFPVVFSEKVINTCLQLLVPAFERNKKDWMVITLLHWKKAGTKELNKKIRAILKKPEELTEGERVIVTKPVRVICPETLQKAYVGKTMCLVKEVDEKEVLLKSLKNNFEFRVKRNLVAHAYALEVYTSQGLETDYALFFVPQLKNGNSSTEEEFERKIKVGLTRARKATFALVHHNLAEKIVNLAHRLIGKDKVNFVTVSNFRELMKIRDQIIFQD